MKKRSAAQDGWGLQRFGSNLRPLSDRSPPMIVSSFHSPGPGYHIKYQDLREIHRAVVADDPKKLQDVEELLHFALCDIKERDRKNRTALHLACAIGRVDVVKYLLAWKCDVNLRDGENRTALVKAVQCQEEACVDILLKKGADPNAKDFKGNTALHYAAFEGNILIARKLLFKKGEIEAKNKDGLTPVLVALNENKEQMVKFLVGKGARLLSGDTVKSSDQLISEHEEEMKPENSSQNHDLVAKKSEEVSLSRLEVENAELKVTVKEQASQTEQLQKDLLSSSSCGDEKENLLQFRLDQEVKKNEELEKENTGLKNHLNMLRRMLSKYENGELPFYGDLKTSQTEMEIQINMLRQKIGDLRARLETESSRCIDLDAKNQVLQQELLSMKATERECEKLKQIKKNLEEKVVNLRSHAEVNVVQGIQVEKYYKWEIDQRVRLIVEERLKEVNLFLQRQAASQENLEQLRASHDASIRSQVVLRIKELESELQSQIRNSQELKIELEKYRQLYLEESEMRMSLTKKLSKTNERLADITTKYLVERQQNRPFHSTLTIGPVLEGPYVGNLTSSLLLDRNVTPRENVMIPTSRPQTSVSSIQTHLIKMLQEWKDNIIRDLKEVARDCESGFCRSSPLGPTDESNVNQDPVLQASREYVEILNRKYMI
ncbi:ankyrin repeat domain-containing protein 26-like isoform X1 [Canis aureus]